MRRSGVFRNWLSVFRALALGRRLTHAIERHRRATAALDAAVREVLGL